MDSDLQMNNHQISKRELIVRWRPFSEYLILIGVWEGEKELAYLTVPPEMWDNQRDLEILLQYLINQGMI